MAFTRPSAVGAIPRDMRMVNTTEGRAASSIALALIVVACASVPPPLQGPSAPPVIAGPLDLPPKILTDMAASQCVPFAREVSGVQIYGDAHTWRRQAEGRYRLGARPEPGAVLVMQGYNTTARGHVAVVTAIRGPREILVDQANWLNRGEISVRVPVRDVSPGNDWSEVRVWHIPTGQWGGRVYNSEGFIFPQ
jgi:hypothetical protein